jgi:prepilin-type N-terminal cleavage/methylation domain-containing protein/prepilin-type processing-associated H-X9-DG protein
MQSANRRALTMVELLVVVAIIGVLAGLLLPVIMKIRETSNRMICVNNLKQIGVAFHSHHTALGYFPSGGWHWWTPPRYDGGQPLVGSKQTAGWGFQILPYLDAVDVWRGGPLVAIATPNPIFFCPARREPQTITYEDQYTPSLVPPGQLITHALMDYAASNLEGTGAVRQFYPLSISDITDGTSQTLLAGEKRLDLGWLGTNAPDDNEGYTCGFDHDSMRLTTRRPAPDPRESDNATGDNLFGSSHPDVFNVVFADGSVHTLSYQISRIVFSYLGNKSDGNAISESDF